MSNEENKNKNTLTGLVVAIILLVLTFISYAFVRSNVDQTNKQNVGITTSDVHLEYTDCVETNVEDCSVTADLKPGESTTKDFKVYNAGEQTGEYTIYFTKLINTFTNNELVYKLEEVTNPSVPVTEVAETPVPAASTAVANTPIKQNILLASGETKNYRLTVTFKSVAANQNYNSTSKFDFKLGLLPLENLTITFNANGGSVSPTAKVVFYDDVYDELPTPTRNGYAFLGWYKDSSFQNPVSTNTTVDTSQNTLYAKWENSQAVGQRINIGDQYFRIISNDGTNIRALAEYNLYVGYNTTYISSTDSYTETAIDSTASNYGLQNSSSVGCVANGDDYACTGVLNFSNTNQRGETKNAYIDSIVWKYTNEYIAHLNKVYKTNLDGDAITFQELKALCGKTSAAGFVCPSTLNNDDRTWVYQTAYWSGSPRISSVYVINANLEEGKIGSAPCEDSFLYYGVRPVIVIPITA